MKKEREIKNIAIIHSLKYVVFILKITKVHHNMKLAENNLYNDSVCHYLLY